jgi:hypothetical protein
VNGNLSIPVAVVVKKILLYESGKEDEWYNGSPVYYGSSVYWYGGDGQGLRQCGSPVYCYRGGEKGCDGMGHLSIVMAVMDKVEMEWVICLLLWW